MSETTNGQTQQRDILLEVKGLKKYFPVQQGWLRRVVGHVKAVDDVSFDVERGETLGVVGESGCGKTTLGRCIVRLYDITDGEINLKNQGQVIPIARLNRNEMRDLRSNVQIIFQDPVASLNPRMSILEIVGEPLLVNGIAKGRELEDRVTKVIRQVGLRVEHLRRYPHSFSGGQRQRIGIARALVVNPQLVVADEPVSALDVSIQAQTLNLMQSLQQEYGLTYVFVSHDMSVVRHLCDRIAVMYAGKLAEIGPKHEILSRPKHPYTEALLAAVPKISARYQGKKRQILVGEPPDLANAPSGCVLSPRCKYAEDICRTEIPPLQKMSDGHFASCHFSDKLELVGID
ncbi:MAG: oligopeptide/dipeptide ABC transporter ATP-binding protein [Chloroflexota bacterium]